MDFKQQRQIMVDSQVRVNDVTDPALVAAFLGVPREAFLPKALQASAYAEVEFETWEGRAMWTPRDLGKMLRALEPKPDALALVVAAGAGYSAALIGAMVETVIALEDTEEAVEAMTERFAKIGLDQAVAISGTLSEGVPDQGPFDLVFVAGMVSEVPQAWLDQIADGGRLGVVVAAGKGLGRARIYRRTGDIVSHRDVFECCPPVLPGFEPEASFVF